MWNQGRLRAFVQAERTVSAVYDATKHFPFDQRHLAVRMRHTASAISGNIIEGCTRSVKTESDGFLALALRALQEVIADADAARRSGVLAASAYQALTTQVAEVSHLLNEATRASESPPQDGPRRSHRTPQPSPHRVTQVGGVAE